MAFSARKSTPRRLRRRSLALGVLGATGQAACSDSRDGTIRQRVTIEPGPNATAEIQLALDDGLIVDLEKGTYLLTGPIFLPSGATLVGAGSGLTELHPMWLPPPEAADVPTNAVLVARLPTPSGSVTTTNLSAPKDSLYLALTDPAAATPGWLRLRGNNTGDDEYEMSDGPDVVLTEYVKASLVDASGAALAYPTRQFHAAGTEVQGAEPLEDIELSGFDLSGDGGSIAVGILLDGVVGAKLEDIAGAGFSRSLIELGPGTREVKVARAWSRGENNALVLAESVMDLSLESFGSSALGARSHPLGIPRGLLTFSRRCTGVRAVDGDLASGCVGIRLWGGHHIHFANIMIRDMFNGAPLERDPLVAGNRTGVGIDTGPAPLSIAEFAYDVTFEDVHLEDCRQPELDHLASWYLHDIFGLNISNCSISNKGASPWTPGDYMAGMLASDVMGSIESLTLRGLANSFHTINTMVFLKVTHLDIMGSPGVAPVGAVGLKLEHGAAGGLSIERLSAENLHTLFITGPEFVPDWSFTVEDFRSEGFEATNLVLGFSLEAQPLYSGDVVELVATTSTERHLVSSTGPSTRNAIVATGAPGSPGQGYMLVVPAPVSRCQVRCTTAAVQIGDLIVASGIPRRAEANNDPPSPFVVLGKALTAKPDGVEGLVLLGPA